MEHFLINSSVCLFVLWLTYKLLLENTSWHHFKRFYLLFSIVVAITIPFIVVETVVIPLENTPLENFVIDQSPAIQTTTQTILEEPAFQIDWMMVMLIVYGTGVIIMLWRFVKNLRAFCIQEEDEMSSYSGYDLVLRNVFTVPHSFLNRIFVSRKEFQNKQIPHAVLEHEKAHLDQKHSIDILLIEVLLILFWFNPLLYLLKYSIKLNHEFLADNAVILQGVETTTYQKTLLNFTQKSHSSALANTFNFPIIKKRFQIMKTQTTQTSLLLRSVAIIPILALLVMSCGKEETEFQEVEELIIEQELSLKKQQELLKNQKQIIVNGNFSSGYITIQDSTYFYTIKEDKVEIYDRWGTKQDFESQGYEVLVISEEVVEEIPLSSSAIEYINENGDELNYYLREDQISKETAIHIIKQYGQNGVEISPDANGTMSIKILENEQNKGTLPPPPPPAPLKAEGYMKVDDKIYYYTTKKDDHNFYDRKGNIINVEGKYIEQIEQSDLPPPPPPATNTNKIKIKESLEVLYKSSDSTYVFKDENGQLKNLYMTNQPSGKVISVDLSTVEPRKPTLNQLKAWKTQPEKFAIWYNGKPISNSEVQTKDLEDIIHYNSSFVFKNARSEKYPQPYQVSIFDNEGFDYAYKSSNP